MAINKYGLRGIGTNIQFGKGGGRILWNTDHFEVRDVIGRTYMPIYVPRTPSRDQEAARKGYVDQVRSGSNPKDPVVAATTAAGTLSTDFIVGSTVDGYTLQLSDRILIKNQTNAAENGIYTVNRSGSPTRSTDTNTADLMAHAATLVTNGRVNAFTSWITTFQATDTLGTDPVNWVQTSASATYTASHGVQLIGADFRLNLHGLRDVRLSRSDEFVAYDVNGGGPVKRTIGEFLGDLNIPNGIITTGLVAAIGSSSYTRRSIGVGTGRVAGLSVRNGDGVRGDPTLGLSIRTMRAVSRGVDLSDRVPVYDVRATTNSYYTIGQIAGARVPNGWATITPRGNSNTTSVVAATSAATVNFAAGAGIEIDGNGGSNTLSFRFVRRGLRNTVTVGADSVVFFRRTNSNVPAYRRWTNIIRDIGLVTTASYSRTDATEITALVGLGTGLVVKTGAGAYTTVLITGSRTAGQEGITTGNADGTRGDPTVGLNIHGQTRAAVRGTGEIIFYNGTNNRKRSFTSLIGDLGLITATAAAFTTNPVTFPTGRNRNPSIRFRTDGTTGLYRAATGKLGVAANSVTGMVIDGTATGRTDYLTVTTSNRLGVTVGAAGSTNTDLILQPRGTGSVVLGGGIKWTGSLIGRVLAINTAGIVSQVVRPDGSGNQLLRYNDSTNTIEWVRESEGGSDRFGTIDLSGNGNGTRVGATTTGDTVTLTGGAGIQLNGNSGTKTITVQWARNGLTDTAIGTTAILPYFASDGTPERRSISNVVRDLRIPSGITTTGLIVRTGRATWTTRTIGASAITGQEGIRVRNGDGVRAAPTIGFNMGGLARTRTVRDSDILLVQSTSNKTIAWSRIKSQLLIQSPVVQVFEATVTYNGGRTQAIGTLPDKARVLRARVIVDTIWNTTETISIGINGGRTTSIMDVTENDPTISGIYECRVDLRNRRGRGQAVQARVRRTNSPRQGSARIYIEYYTASLI